MQIETIEVREDTLSQIAMTLYSNDSVINLSGIDHVRLDMVDTKGKTYRFSSDDASPQTEIVTAASGIVGYTPASGDLSHARSPYKGYWWVYPTSSTRYSVPEENEFEITVRKEF